VTQNWIETSCSRRIQSTGASIDSILRSDVGIQHAVTKIRYPEWEFAFVDAILEYDPAKATDKSLRARTAMTLRLHALTSQESVERSAILNGLCSLTIHLERITAA
jgi:hypothetical protein